MPKSILVIAPTVKKGMPAAERTQAFVDFFEAKGVECAVHATPSSSKQLFQLVRKIYRDGTRNILVTMPPFRNWMLCFLPGVNTILDLRDGWSIAMKRGYGGTAPARPVRSWIARIIEQLAVASSALTITCTPGLMRYHSTRLARRRMCFIPNGFPASDLPMVQKLRADRPDQAREAVVYICAGKFSEYGPERVKKLVDDISAKNRDRHCIIRVYSESAKSNEWVSGYIAENNIDNVVFENVSPVSRAKILAEIVSSDFGIVVVREPDYEFGTKIFDYVLCGTKVVYGFEDKDQFDEYFGSIESRALDADELIQFSREAGFEKQSRRLMFHIR